MRVLFVCRSNAGRSQCAEAFFNSLSKEHNASSAGFDVKETGVEGFPPGKRIIDAMDGFGIDISGMKRKQLKMDALKRANRIVVLLERRERKILPAYFRDFSDKTSFWDVKDPRRMRSDKAVRDTLGGIRKRVNRLIREID